MFISRDEMKTISLSNFDKITDAFVGWEKYAKKTGGGVVGRERGERVYRTDVKGRLIKRIKKRKE